MEGKNGRFVKILQKRLSHFTHHPSELEIDEGLYLGAFHLNDDVDDDGDEEGTKQHVSLLDDCDATLVPAVGDEVGDVAEENHGEDDPIAFNDLQEEFGMEVGENLADHRPRGVEGVVTEENPAEHHKMESEHHGQHAAQAMTLIVLVVVEDVLAHPFVQG